MTPYDILRKARAHIDRPSKWVHYWSVSEDGKRLSADMAIIWAVGETGFHRSLCSELAPVAAEAMRLLADETGINPMWTPHKRVAYFNDDSSHREVMAAFDRAIAKAQEMP